MDPKFSGHLNGQLDREKKISNENCEKLYLPVRNSDDQSQFSPTELKIAQSWSDILNIPFNTISKSDKLFSLGATSHDVSEFLNKGFSFLSFSTLFEDPTIRELAKIVENSKTIEDMQIGRNEVSVEYPLSFEQMDIWNETLDFSPKHPTLIVHFSIYFKDPFDDKSLKRSVEYIVKRHELLRSQILLQKELPVWKLQTDPPEPDFKSFDLTQLTFQEGLKKVLDVETDFLSRIVDLESFPLIHFVSFSFQGGHGCLKVFSHHIVLDGASVVILRNEIMECYSTFCSNLDHPILEKLPIQYSDYAIWQKRRFETDTHFVRKVKSYWETKLANFIPLVLPGDRDPFPKYPRMGKFMVFDFSDGLSSQIKAYSQGQSTIPFTILYSGLISLLYRSTGQTDITILSITKGRTHKDTRNLIGHMMNFIALRTDLSGNPKFEDVVRAVHKDLIDCIEHQDYPFPLLIKNCTKGSPELQDKLYNTVVQILPLDIFKTDEAELSILKNLENTENFMPFVANEFFVVFEICPDSRLFRVTINYHVDRFESATIKKIMANLFRLLEKGIEYPSVSIDDIELV